MEDYGPACLLVRFDELMIVWNITRMHLHMFTYPLLTEQKDCYSSDQAISLRAVR